MPPIRSQNEGSSDLYGVFTYSDDTPAREREGGHILAKTVSYDCNRDSDMKHGLSIEAGVLRH